jgi:hypothetical protein
MKMTSDLTYSVYHYLNQRLPVPQPLHDHIYLPTSIHSCVQKHIHLSPAPWKKEIACAHKTGYQHEDDKQN